MHSFLFLLLSLFTCTAFAYVTLPKISISRLYSSMPTRIAIDYAPRRIGVAMSDPLGNISPHGIIFNYGNMTDTSIKIIDLALLYRAKEVIVGFPVDRNGRIRPKSTNFNGRMCYNFTRVLSSTAASYAPGVLAIKAYDESYTTREARFRITSGDYKGSLDSVSAACILEHYIADHGELSVDVNPSTIKPGEDILDYQAVREYTAKYKQKQISFKTDSRNEKAKIVKLVEPLPSNPSEADKARHDKHVEFFKWFHRTETPMNFQKHREVMDFSDPDQNDLRLVQS